MTNEIKILDKTIGIDHPVYFIADIAANHDGDIERAKELIYLAAESGADAAKFQHFQAETIVSDVAFKSMKSQLSHQAAWKKSVFEVYQDASVSLDWNEELKKTCEDAGIHFFTTPYAIDIVHAVDDLVPAYKIGSGDITWPAMIETVASKGKPYLLACGASNIDEVIDAVKLGLSINENLLLMQCNTNYTASLENFKYINLNVLNSFKNLFPDLLLGLSDHTPGHSTVLGAITLGARAIEKHFTDDTSREGPDHKFSMDPFSWREMVDRSRELEISIGSSIKKIEDNEKDSIIVQRRSICLDCDMKSGEIISIDKLTMLRPCPTGAFKPSELSEVEGRKLAVNKVKGEPLMRDDIFKD